MDSFWHLCVEWAWLAFLMAAIEAPAEYVAYMLKADPLERMLFYSLVINERLKQWSVFAGCVAICKWVVPGALLIFFGWRVLIAFWVTHFAAVLIQLPALFLFRIGSKSPHACLVVRPITMLILSMLFLIVRRWI